MLLKDGQNTDLGETSKNKSSYQEPANVNAGAWMEFATNISTALAVQTVLFGGAENSLPDKASDDWSVGYLLGFTDTMLNQNSRIEKDDWPTIELAVFNQLFGKANGNRCFNRACDLIKAKNEEAISGFDTGLCDITFWNNKKDVSKYCSPGSWSDYVLGTLDEMDEMREQAFPKYWDEYIDEVKRLDPDKVINGNHWLELTDDLGTKELLSMVSIPKI